jgi:uncharacterized protein (DUF1778 family)
VTEKAQLTETIRVRLTPADVAELEQAAAADDRNVSAFARRAIRRELDRLRDAKPGRK